MDQRAPLGEANGSSLLPCLCPPGKTYGLGLFFQSGCHRNIQPLLAGRYLTAATPPNPSVRPGQVEDRTPENLPIPANDSGKPSRCHTLHACAFDYHTTATATRCADGMDTEFFNQVCEDPSLERKVAEAQAKQARIIGTSLSMSLSLIC